VDIDWLFTILSSQENRITAMLIIKKTIFIEKYFGFGYGFVAENVPPPVVAIPWPNVPEIVFSSTLTVPISVIDS
jgi:hypothetical protein